LIAEIVIASHLPFKL